MKFLKKILIMLFCFVSVDVYAIKIETDVVIFTNKVTFSNTVDHGKQLLTNAILKEVFGVSTNTDGSANTNNISGVKVWTNSAGSSPSTGGSFSNLFWVDKNNINQTFSSDVYTLAGWEGQRLTDGNITTNGRYTSVKDGNYAFIANISFPDAATQPTLGVYLYTNGVRAFRGGAGSAAGNASRQVGINSVFSPIYLASNSYAEIYIWMYNADMVVQGDCTNTWFKGYYLGN